MSPPTLHAAPPVPNGRPDPSVPPMLLRRAISVDTTTPAAAQPASARAPPPGVPVPPSLLRALSCSATGSGGEPDLDLSLRLYRPDSARLWLPATPALSPAALVAAALGKESGLSAAVAAAGLADQASTSTTPPASSTQQQLTVRAALVATPTVHFGVAPCGTGHTARFFITATGGGGGAVPVSPWHDVPLKAGTQQQQQRQQQAPPPPLFNFVVEVPAGTTPKLEVDTGAGPLNPLAQDTTAAGAPRFFPAPLFFNYGMLPKTWESPHITDPDTGAPGDGDPVDVVEVGGWLDEAAAAGKAAERSQAPGALPVGAVVPVKVLGALALIDSGELDWKVIAIRATHPAAPALASVADLEAAVGHAALDRLVKWFTTYKTFEGKPPNAWGRGGAPIGPEEAVSVIEGAAAAYEGAGLGPPSVPAPPGLLVVRARSRVVVPP